MQTGPASSIFCTLRDELKNKGDETHFRERHLKKDINQASLYISFAALPTAIALIATLVSHLFLEQTDYQASHIFTNATVLLTIAIFVVAVHLSRAHRNFERIIFLYMTLLGASLLYNQFTRPADYVGTLYLLYILNNTVLMPVPLRVQIIPTTIFSVIMLAIIITHREPTYHSESINVIITITTLTLLGTIVSVMLGRYRRLSHLHFTNEQETRAKLEDTLAKIKKLSGIVPICSHCLKIRDEKGAWQRTEAYIEQHSDAQFSHGICPDCVNENYSEL